MFEQLKIEELILIFLILKALLYVYYFSGQAFKTKEMRFKYDL